MLSLVLQSIHKLLNILGYFVLPVGISNMTAGLSFNKGWSTLKFPVRSN